MLTDLDFTRTHLSHIVSYPRPLTKSYYEEKLDSNESFYGCSPHVLHTLQTITTQDVSQYPAYGDLIAELARLNQVNPAEITVTSGTDEAIGILYRLLTKQNDKVVILDPSFAMYTTNADILRLELIKIPYKENFIFPAEELLNQLDQTVKLLILGNPNNPTGEQIDAEILEKILQKGIPTLIDEVYFKYGKYSAQQFLKHYKNLIILRSFSKDYGLAGLRVGYVLADPDIIDLMNKLLCPYNVNSLAVMAAISAIQDTEFIDYVVSSVNNTKAYLTNKLTLLGYTVYPSEGNYLLVRCGAKAQWVYEKLRANKILIKKFDHPLLRDCIRITIPDLTLAERMVKLLAPYDTIIFDMDGVLADVSASYREAIKLTYEFYTHKQLDGQRIQKLKDTGGYNNDWKLTETLLLEDGLSVDYDNIIHTFNKYYLGHENLEGLIHKENLLLDQANLNKLAQKYKLAICTGRPREDAEIFLTTHNIQGVFDLLITMDDLTINEQKPHPRGIYKIINHLNSKNALYFGDSIDDAWACSSASIDFIGISQEQVNYSSNSQILIDHGALFVLHDINQICTIL